VTRSFKPIPNDHIRETLSDPRLVGFDGEIMIPYSGWESETDRLTVDQIGMFEKFNQVQSRVMSKGGQPEFRFAVFDLVDFHRPDEPFTSRLGSLIERYIVLRESLPLMWTPQVLVNHREVEYQLAKFLEEGHEGMMLRHPEGPYKFGRSTLNQGYLVALKEFEDAEGTVVDMEELMHNENEAETDELGYTKRSSSKEGKVPSGMMGKLILQTEWGELRVGSGFDFATRREIFENFQAYHGRVVTFKYQPHGMQDKPRAPIFKGFRPEVEQ
jgi:DNA ligase-1